MRRIFIILPLILSIAVALWWFNRPQPIAVVLVEVTHGKVESSVAHTRVDSLLAHQTFTY